MNAPAPDPSELRARWAEDGGAFRDIYVVGSTVEEWQRVLDAVLVRWPTSYTEDGEPTPMRGAGDILARRSTRGTLLRVHLREQLDLDAHFFGPEEIEFTFDPSEVLDDADVYRIFDFVLHIGRALGRAVHMTTESFEGDRPPDDLRYDPEADRLVFRD